ncbi:hypothetical protein T492DRAFT_50646 [Pavlovales sp. CCMP2436]|nr:hypothetical protein T492DRAFT_50646 [Pavlovales sp. CCMP2436]
MTAGARELLLGAAAEAEELLLGAAEELRMGTAAEAGELRLGAATKAGELLLGAAAEAKKLLMGAAAEAEELLLGAAAEAEELRLGAAALVEELLLGAAAEAKDHEAKKLRLKWTPLTGVYAPTRQTFSGGPYCGRCGKRSACAPYVGTQRSSSRVCEWRTSAAATEHTSARTTTAPRRKLRAHTTSDMRCGRGMKQRRPATWALTG